MTQITIDQLREATKDDRDDSSDLALAYNGVVSAKRAYQEKSGSDTERDWTAAEARLEKVRQRLIDKYFPAERKRTSGLVFNRQKEAREYIRSLGFKVSDGKFSQDSHKFTVRGEIHQDDLLDYARASLRKNTTETDLGAKREEAETRKAIADANKAEINAQQLQRELDKAWILRADAEDNECVAAALVRDGIAHQLNKQLPAIIHSAGGDPARQPDVQAIIDQAITTACNDIANSGEVEIDIEDDEDAA